MRKVVLPAAVLVLALAGCGGGEELAAETLRADQLEAQVESMSDQLRIAEKEATGAAAQAEAALADRERAAAEQEAALVEREKAVGIAETEAAANTFGPGTHIVGDDIQPGTYKSEGSEGCYWERTDGSGDIIENSVGDGPAVMVVRASDFSVTVSRCAPFMLSR